jgi:chemotaxis-related protein WspB
MLLLTFIAGGNRYAVDAARVVELVPRIELRSVPHAPAFLAGLLSYRGTVVPVIDLGVLLAAAACRDRLSTRIILVDDRPANRDDGKEVTEGEHGSRPNRTRGLHLLGLIAEQVNDLTDANPDRVAPAPVDLPRFPYLGPIVQTDQGIVQLITVEEIRNASLGGEPAGLQAAVNPASPGQGTGHEADHAEAEHELRGVT